jgi:hypothetical protein
MFSPLAGDGEAVSFLRREAFRAGRNRFHRTVRRYGTGVGDATGRVVGLDSSAT